MSYFFLKVGIKYNKYKKKHFNNFLVDKSHPTEPRGTRIKGDKRDPIFYKDKF